MKAVQFPNEIDKSIGARLREKRMSIGLSEEDLAQTLNIDPEDFCFFEQGLKRISAQQLLLIAKALGVQSGYFFGVLSRGAERSRLVDYQTAEEPKNRPALVEQGLRLQRAFFKVKNPALRETIVNLVIGVAKFGETR
ncbi:MAG TPA: helix-turn-helix transcriptional regulator [Roseiarcus sp.]|nr:helix-turn-helix transcriptional regulator [Roseiarcus sp.]